MLPEIKHIVFSDKFEKDYKGLKPDIKKRVNEVLEDLLKKPIPGGIHIKKYKGHSNPNIYAIHVTSNHSHKISFELENGRAILRRIASHKEVDNMP